MAPGSVDGRRSVASRTEKCWIPSVALVTIGPFGPFGRLSAHGDQVPTAAAPATPAAAPRNFRRSMRMSSCILRAPPPSDQRTARRLLSATDPYVLPLWAAKRINTTPSATVSQSKARRMSDLKPLVLEVELALEPVHELIRDRA